MVDYYKVIGTNPNPDYKGRMRIRDTGLYVEFWIKAGSKNTWVYSASYGWTVNGNTGSSTFSYGPGGDWKKLRTFKVTTTQNVTFRLGATGTEGLGGPYTFTVKIDRARKPSPPSAVKLTNIQATSMYATFKDGANNGAPITARQIAYGRSKTTKPNIVSSDGSTTIKPLHPGIVYFFWARTRNEKGWSDWSPRSRAQTLGGVHVKINGTWRNAVPYIKINGVWRVTRPWIKASGKWRECG